MEWEAILFGIEPIIALGVGIAAIILAPVIGAIANPELGQSIVESGCNLIKDGLQLGMDTVEKIQISTAEASEVWHDLVAEARAEIDRERNSKQPPREVEIADGNS